MKFNEKNIIVKNILTKEEIERVKDSVVSAENSNQFDILGYYVWHLTMPEDIVKKFTRIAEEICGEELVLEEYNTSRYELRSNDDGSETHPLLFPHTDEAFKEERFTLDYQLESNISWPIIVKSENETKELVLLDNEAGTFSGTHQVHWRPKRIFNKGEFLTLIFMHFKKANGAKELSLEHINHMRNLAKIEYDEWMKQEGRSNNEMYDPNNEPRYNKKEKL